MSNRYQLIIVSMLSSLAVNINAGTLTAEKIEAEEVLVKEIGLYQLDDKGILCYPFTSDEANRVTDVSNSEFDGTVNSCVWTNAGPYGGSMYFDGFGDYIDVGSAPNVPTWNQYSVSVWFYHNGGGDFGPNYGHKIIDKTMFYHDWYICVKPETGRLYLHMYESGGVSLVAGTNNYMDSTWHHAVVVRDGGAGWFWVDGELKGSRTTGMKSVNSTSDLCVGNSFSTDYYQRKAWSGMLDEIRIYDYPLTSNQVARLYNENMANLTNAPNSIVVSTNLTVNGDMTASGSVSFAEGVIYSKPLGGLSSGIYTNTP
ncbi:MAG: LamG domain-containing protein [Kiritimatiellia bacterium]